MTSIQDESSTAAPSPPSRTPTSCHATPTGKKKSAKEDSKLRDRVRQLQIERDSLGSTNVTTNSDTLGGGAVVGRVKARTLLD